jgi:ABC-type glycerol-3-phosphate transport system permease component
MARKTTFKAEFLKHSYLWFVIGTALYPLFVMVVVSLKTNEQYQLNPWFSSCATRSSSPFLSACCIGYAIASIPLILLFLFTMRLFVKGLAAGAVKG